MSYVFVALICLLVGFAVGWWYIAPMRPVRENLARRNRVLYELAEGDSENVAQELEQICETEPGDPTVFLALAALDRRRGRVERAKAVHRTVLASADLPSEQRVAALVGLGRDLLAQGNERAAVGALVRAASLAPRSVATLETLAKALERAGAWERAAAAWERLEKQVEGRRAQEARVGRGHVVAGQASEALEDGEDKKARKLAERAVDLAPDSGHCWAVRARVEAEFGDPSEALESWQRAWELSPAGARTIVPEAWEWASEHGRQGDLMERMLSSLRIAREPHLVVALAERVARQHLDQAAAALERVAERSPSAQLALIRMRLARGQREQASEAAMRAPASSGLLCRRCSATMERFSFRCPSCGAWDSATTVGLEG
ncbi:tetratricopeptide repeat protein [Pseudenhygromyxa sp. WMMC2535]|uniref:tetratricopeptide repeat protein n=1 Tax=Pseudenhygromyxa sp. WMMC2535 TaxID=2712867 RepID=UPI001551E00A|nr:tetratricopeptide repeat protein [Pseudenhygromyxa sp. WMMC2535]NVB42027.1 tetratricopeptide repeat protein [Pseudenhygromyxa sp. WMMC2535]